MHQLIWLWDLYVAVMVGYALLFIFGWGFFVWGVTIWQAVRDHE